MSIKDALPIRAQGNVEHRSIRQLVTLQRDEFQVCHPLIREVATWLGLKKKVLLVHRTTEGRWDIKKVDL